MSVLPGAHSVDMFSFPVEFALGDIYLGEL